MFSPSCRNDDEELYNYYKDIKTYKDDYKEGFYDEIQNQGKEFNNARKGRDLHLKKVSRKDTTT